jgi:hypothetical protein
MVARGVAGTEPERLGGRASLAGRWGLITVIGSVASAAILVSVLAGRRDASRRRSRVTPPSRDDRALTAAQSSAPAGSTNREAVRGAGSPLSWRRDPCNPRRVDDSTAASGFPP